MNKKLISSLMVMAISVAALSPFYGKLSLYNNLHPTTELSDSTGPVSASGYTVTYDFENPQGEAMQQKNSVQLNSDEMKTKAAATPESNSVAPTTNSVVKAPVQPKTTVKTTVTKKTTTSSRSTTGSTSTRVTRLTRTQAPAVKPVSTTVPSTTSSKALSVIRTAKSLIGVPYVWGGTTPAGFDCSGFSQYVLAKNGISVPRTAAEQYKSGISVSRSSLRVGDLVFFTTYKPGPSHLGFYIGDGKFIHASSSKGVTISSLGSSYYSSRYIGARRVIK